MRTPIETQQSKCAIATFGRTWVVAQVNDEAFHSPVLCHVEGIDYGSGALRAKVVQAQVADGGAIRQPYQRLHACQNMMICYVKTDRRKPAKL